MPHALTRTDMDLARFAVELGDRLGRPVAVSARAPQGGQDGVLIVVDPATGQELNVDGRTVLGAIRSHVPPPTAAQQRANALSAAEAKAAKGDTAGALADVLALLRAGG